jgi:hypothetical protein
MAVFLTVNDVIDFDIDGARIQDGVTVTGGVCLPCPSAVGRRRHSAESRLSREIREAIHTS